MGGVRPPDAFAAARPVSGGARSDRNAQARHEDVMRTGDRRSAIGASPCRGRAQSREAAERRPSRQPKALSRMDRPAALVEQDRREPATIGAGRGRNTRPGEDGKRVSAPQQNTPRPGRGPRQRRRAGARGTPGTSAIMRAKPKLGEAELPVNVALRAGDLEGAVRMRRHRRFANTIRHSRAVRITHAIKSGRAVGPPG